MSASGREVRVADTGSIANVLLTAVVLLAAAAVFVLPLVFTWIMLVVR
jgi:hypothetical protein